MGHVQTSVYQLTLSLVEGGECVACKNRHICGCHYFSVERSDSLKYICTETNLYNFLEDCKQSLFLLKKISGANVKTARNIEQSLSSESAYQTEFNQRIILLPVESKITICVNWLPAFLPLKSQSNVAQCISMLYIWFDILSGNHKQ